MRHVTVLLMSFLTLLSLSVGWAQDVGININMVPATIANGGTGVIQVDICNNDFSLTAPANKLRPLISGNTLIEIVSIDNADFTIQNLGTGANNSMRLLYNKTLAPHSCATVNITVKGVTQGGPSTITGTLGFNGPQTVDNDTANDNSTTGVTVSAATDLTSYTFVRPLSVRGTSPITVVVDLEELRGGATSGPITVKVSKGSYFSLSFSSGTTSLDSRPVQNSVWSFDASSDPNYYVLTTNAVIAANDVLSFGLTGTLTPGNTNGMIAISTSVVAGSGGDSQPNNNASASKIDYFQQ